MDAVSVDIMELLDNAPRQWRYLFRDELAKVDFNGLTQEKMASIASELVQRTSERYRDLPLSDWTQDEICELIQTLIPAPTEFIRALTKSILEEHPELAWGDYIVPDGN